MLKKYLILKDKQYLIVEDGSNNINNISMKIRTLPTNIYDKILYVLNEKDFFKSDYVKFKEVNIYQLNKVRF